MKRRHSEHRGGGGTAEKHSPEFYPRSRCDPLQQMHRRRAGEPIRTESEET
jgi:hypothetical protein